MSDEIKKVQQVVERKVSGTVAVGNVNPTQMLDLLKKGGTEFLPRLQLQTSNSKDCKSGEFPVNHYALASDQTLKDVGTTADVLVLAVRMQALDFSDDENIVSCFDPKVVDGEPTGTFKDIMDRASGADSKCMWGSQFLVYLPSQQSFATVFFGTKTSRRDAPAMMAKLGKAATLGAKKIPNKKFGDYFSMSVMNCSEPLDAPSTEAIGKEIERFQNPPEQVVEKATTEEKEATDQAR